jgi:hypothetical protein
VIPHQIITYLRVSLGRPTVKTPTPFSSFPTRGLASPAQLLRAACFFLHFSPTRAAQVLPAQHARMPAPFLPSLPPADRWVPPVWTFPFRAPGSVSSPSPTMVRCRPARAASRTRTPRLQPPYLKPRPHALAPPQAAAAAFTQNPKRPSSSAPPPPRLSRSLLHRSAAPRRRASTPEASRCGDVLASRFFPSSTHSRARILLIVVPSCPSPPAAVSGRCRRSPSLLLPGQTQAQTVPGTAAARRRIPSLPALSAAAPALSAAPCHRIPIQQVRLDLT